MFRFFKSLNQKGVVHLIPLLILLAGIIGGLYLVQHPQIFKPKADESPTGPGYAKWLTQMQAMGVYPAEEDGEIILYDRKTFVEKYCQPNPCYLNPSSFEELSSAIDKDKEFIHALGNKLREEDYAPLSVLEPYFPNIKQLDEKSLGGALQALEPICRGGEEPICVPQLITYISEEDLTKFINQVATEKALEEKDPIKNFIIFTNPIFGFRSLVDVISLPPHQVSYEDRLNAIFGFTIIYGLTERVAATGFKVTAEAVVDLTKLIQEMGPIRKQILAGQPMALDIVAERFPQLLASQRLPTRPNSVITRAPAWSNKRNVFPTAPQFQPGQVLLREGALPIPKITHSTQLFYAEIKPVLEAGHGALISRTDVLRPVADNVRNAVTSFEARIGEQLPIRRAMFDNAIDNGTVYTLEDQYVKAGAGYTYGDMIVLGYERYYSERGIGSLHHEMTHMLGKDLANGWRYGGPTERDKSMTAIYELMTDAWADISMGQRVMSQGSHIATGGYAREHPEIIEALFNRLFRNNPQLQDDFLRFALDKNGERLVARFGGYEQFLAHFRQRGVNFRAVAYSAPAIELLNQLTEEQDEEGVSVDPIIEIDADLIQDVPEESPINGPGEE